jgi:hypothetical protein
VGSRGPLDFSLSFATSHSRHSHTLDHAPTSCSPNPLDSDVLYRAALDAATTGEHRFGSILNVSDKCFYLPTHAWIHLHHEPMDDFGRTALTETTLTRCFDTIDAGLQSDTKAALVHCTVGVNRSVTIVAAYLITRRGYTCEDALGLIRHARPQMRPVQAYTLALHRLVPATLPSQLAAGHSPNATEVPHSATQARVEKQCGCSLQ